jgi:hypothetical protein
VSPFKDTRRDRPESQHIHWIEVDRYPHLNALRFRYDLRTHRGERGTHLIEARRFDHYLPAIPAPYSLDRRWCGTEHAQSLRTALSS